MPGDSSFDMNPDRTTVRDVFLVESRACRPARIGVCRCSGDRFEIDWFDGTHLNVESLSNVAVYRLPDDHKAPLDYFSPDWKDCGRVHEWKNYISFEVRTLWNTFTRLQRASLARQADAMASAEDWD